MPEAVIVDAIRTPIGRAVKGSLKSVRADDLAAIPLRALIERNPQLDQKSIGDVMMGCGYGEGEQGYNVGRIATLLAGHRPPRARHAPSTVSARPRCRPRGWRSTRSRPARATPTSPPVSRPSRAPGAVGAGSSSTIWSTAHAGSAYDVYIPMGMTAENVADRCNVSREAQDEWAVISQARAVAAVESGHFDSEIVPVTVPAHKDDRQGGQRGRRARDGCLEGRRPAGGDDDGEARRAEARVQGGRHRSRPATLVRSTTAPRRYS